MCICIHTYGSSHLHIHGNKLLMYIYIYTCTWNGSQQLMRVYLGSRTWQKVLGMYWCIHDQNKRQQSHWHIDVNMIEIKRQQACWYTQAHMKWSGTLEVRTLRCHLPIEHRYECTSQSIYIHDIPKSMKSSESILVGMENKCSTEQKITSLYMLVNWNHNETGVCVYGQSQASTYSHSYTHKPPKLGVNIRIWKQIRMLVVYEHNRFEIWIIRTENCIMNSQN